MAFPPDDDDPVFTPRTMLAELQAAEAFEMAEAATFAAEAQPDPSTSIEPDHEVAAQMSSLESDVPIFTPRSMALARTLIAADGSSADDEAPSELPAFTPGPPRAVNGAASTRSPPPLMFTHREEADWRDDAMPFEGIITPRSRHTVGGLLGESFLDETAGVSEGVHGAQSSALPGDVPIGGSPCDSSAAATPPARCEDASTPLPREASSHSSKPSHGKEGARAKTTASGSVSQRGGRSDKEGRKHKKEGGSKRERREKGGGKGNATMVLDFRAQGGEMVYSLSTPVSSHLLKQPLYDGLIKPALNEYVRIARLGTLSAEHESSLGILVDGSPLERPSFSSNVSSFVKKDAAQVRLTLMLPTAIAVKPRAAGAASQIEQASYQVYIDAANGDNLCSLECTLPRALLSKPLLSGLVQPAMRTFWRADRHNPRVAIETIQIQVDGSPTNGANPASSFVKEASAPVVVTLTLPAPPWMRNADGAPPEKTKVKGKRRSPTQSSASSAQRADSLHFIVDIQTDDAELVMSLGTHPSSKFLSYTLLHALVQPALQDYTKLTGAPIGASAVKVYVDGAAADGSEKLSAYVDGSGEPTGVVIQLPAGSASTVNKGAVRSATFDVDVIEGTTGRRFEFDVKLNHKWLRKPLEKSVVEPALRIVHADVAARQGMVLLIDGEAVDATRPAIDFVTTAGKHVKMVMELPNLRDGRIERPTTLLQRTSTAAREALKETFGARLLGDGSDHLPATKFVVKVHGSLHWEMVTALNRRWLKKPLVEGLVAPALRAYFKADVGAKRCEPKDVRIEVNGVVEDGKKRTEEYVPAEVLPGEKPTRVDIHLPTPQYELTRISKTH